MTFKEFCEIIRGDIASGKIKLTPQVTLTDLDLAVQYAIGQEMLERGDDRPIFTEDEIYYLIGKHCGIEMRERMFNMEDSNESV